MRNYRPPTLQQRRVETRTIPTKSSTKPALKPTKAKQPAPAPRPKLELALPAYDQASPGDKLRILARNVGCSVYIASRHHVVVTHIATARAVFDGSSADGMSFLKAKVAEQEPSPEPIGLHGEAPRALTCECGVCSDWRRTSTIAEPGDDIVDTSLTASGKRELLTHAAKCGLALNFSGDRIEASAIDGPPVFIGQPGRRGGVPAA